MDIDDRELCVKTEAQEGPSLRRAWLAFSSSFGFFFRQLIQLPDIFHPLLRERSLVSELGSRLIHLVTGPLIGPAAITAGSTLRMDRRDAQEACQLKHRDYDEEGFHGSLGADFENAAREHGRK